MATLKYSRQRESIKEFLMTRTDHPTADTVYHQLRKIYPNISLGTVYRNLALLADIGEIQKICTGDGADRFDGQVTSLSCNLHPLPSGDGSGSGIHERTGGSGRTTF